MSRGAFFIILNWNVFLFLGGEIKALTTQVICFAINISCCANKSYLRIAEFPVEKYGAKRQEVRETC
jgi:hypothetical protein